jgi:hypothetical protein
MSTDDESPEGKHCETQEVGKNHPRLLTSEIIVKIDTF